MDFVKNLSQLLEIAEEDIEQKLKLSQGYKITDIAKALNVQGLFETKEDLETYINKKIKNIYEKADKEKESLSEELAISKQSSETAQRELEELRALLSSRNQAIETVVNSTIKKMNFVDKIDHTHFDIDKLDFNNLNVSLTKQAQEKNFNIKEDIVQISKQFEKDNNVVFLKGGGVMKQGD